ncbi:MAG TPA: hypothetical protein VF921_16210 [Vicinamibacterales bacterium]
MRQILMASLVAVTLGSARPAVAQTRAWPERIWFSVSGGVQPTASSFSDGFDVPLYQETEKVSIDYPGKGGALVAASGGYRVWRQLAIGVGLTRSSRRAQAAVDARLPHPFFDNQIRDVRGTTPATRGEVGAHLLVGWMLPLTDRFRVLITAGPSVLSVSQTLVTGVEFAEVYPYDTAAFTRATTKNATVTAAGFNAGADLFWMFSRRVGAGGLVQITRARAKEPAGTGRTVSVDAGGAQVGVGLRLVF